MTFKSQAFAGLPGHSVPPDYGQPSLGYSSGAGHQEFRSLCLLGYFGFLHAAEFTVLNLACFSPAIHLLVADIAVDMLQYPTCLCVRIKASKTDQFRQGCKSILVWEGLPSAQSTRCWLISPDEEMPLAPCSFW